MENRQQNTTFSAFRFLKILILWFLKSHLSKTLWIDPFLNLNMQGPSTTMWWCAQADTSAVPMLRESLPLSYLTLSELTLPASSMSYTSGTHSALTVHTPVRHRPESQSVLWSYFPPFPALILWCNIYKHL